MMKKSLPILTKYYAPLFKVAVGILAYNGLLYLLGQGLQTVVGIYIGFIIGFGAFLLTTTILDRNTPPTARPSKPEGKTS